MAWKKIEVEKISDPEMDVGDYLAMALQVALPIAGGALGASIAGPALAAKGMAIGAGAGQAVGQFATAALQDDPREAQRYLGQGMQAAFTTLPYAADAYEQYQKDKIPEKTSTASSVLPSVGQVPQLGGALDQYQFGGTLGSVPQNKLSLQEGWTQLPGIAPDFTETYVASPGAHLPNLGSVDPRLPWITPLPQVSPQ